MVRDALASPPSLEGDIEVVAQLSRGDEVVGAALASRPDVALLDIEMPGQDGLAAAAALAKALPDLSSPHRHHLRPSRLPASRQDVGATGSLIKDAPPAELAKSLRRAMAGELVIDPGLAFAALAEGDHPLTIREQEIIVAVRVWPTVADIAAALHLSAGTVRNHLSAAGLS